MTSANPELVYIPDYLMNYEVKKTIDTHIEIVPMKESSIEVNGDICMHDDVFVSEKEGVCIIHNIDTAIIKIKKDHDGTIIIEFNDSISKKAVEEIFEKIALPYLIYNQNNQRLILLHSTCLHKEGFMVALAGASTVGKSTLAGKLIVDCGYDLISDDLLYIWNEDNRIIPLISHLKLNQDSMEIILAGRNKALIEKNRSVVIENTRTVNMFCEIRYEENCEEIRLSPVTRKISKIKTILRNVYALPLYSLNEENLKMISDFCDLRGLVVAEMTHGKRWNQLESMADLIEKTRANHLHRTV